MAPLASARGRTAADLEAIGRAQPFFRGAAQELVEALGQGIDTDLVELLRRCPPVPHAGRGS